MSNPLSKKIWLALSAFAVLGMVSPALAKTTHRHHVALSAYAAYGAAPSAYAADGAVSPRVAHPGDTGALRIQDRGYDESVVGVPFR